MATKFELEPNAINDQFGRGCQSLKRVLAKMALMSLNRSKRRIMIHFDAKALYEIHILNDLYNMNPVNHNI
jgi:hypothetical protein